MQTFGQKMKFLSKQGGRADAPKETLKKRPGHSKKQSSRRQKNLSYDEDRLPIDEKHHRGEDQREGNLHRHPSRRKNKNNHSEKRRTSRKERDKDIREKRKPPPQRGRKAARSRSRSRPHAKDAQKEKNTTRRGRSRSRAAHKSSGVNGQRARSSSPVKKSFDGRKSRHSSMPPTTRRSKSHKDRRSRRNTEGRPIKERKSKEPDWEPAEDDLIQSKKGKSHEFPKSLVNEKYDLSKYALPTDFTDGSPASIVEKRHSKFSKLPAMSSIKTMSFEDAGADGCVARYDTVFSNMFDWVDTRTLDEQSALSQPTLTIRKGRKGWRDKYSDRDRLLDALCVEGDIDTDTDTERGSFEILYVDRPETESTDSRSDNNSFSWQVFFSEF